MDILFTDAVKQMGPTAFQVMVKPIGPICNLNCTYCYYLEKDNLYPLKKDFKMPEEILESFIRQQIENQEVPVVNFVWQGGEPALMRIDFYRKAIELEKKYANGKKIENAFQTNGTLLNDEWCEFFKENNFLIGISIDGPEKLHNKYRLTKGNKPSFHKVMHGISLLKKHNVDFNTLSVVNDYNSHYPLEVYNFFKKTGSQFMQFIPIVERIADTPGPDSLKLVSPDFKEDATVSDWSVKPKQFGKFLCAIFDEWVRNDVGKYYIQIFDVSLANWVGANPNLCAFSETCGNATVMEHNGDLYSCDHFVYKENYLGNIMETPLVSMVKTIEQTQFGLNKRDKLPRYCLKCEYRFACHGECPKNRIIKTPDGEPGLNYNCEAYKMFFKHIDPYMQYMAKELNKKRSPANVMNWIRQSELQKSTIKVPERNSPCPCGSGKKYKKCCGKDPSLMPISNKSVNYTHD